MLTTSNLLRARSAAVLAALVAFLPALPAAADNTEPPKVTVKFGDLDVSHPRGAAVLYSRIQSASEQLCSPFDHSDMASTRKMRECVNNAIANAVASANIPTLTNVYVTKQHTLSATRVASLQSQ
jgi:UrcA family protein